MFISCYESFAGIADFNMYDWIKGGIKRCCRYNHQIIYSDKLIIKFKLTSACAILRYILIFPVIDETLVYFLLHRGGKNVQEEIIVAPATPAMNLMAAQLTDDNEDFANRGRYHQSEIVRGENFDDYDSN